MKNIKIKSLKLSNFKGIKSFEITDFNGGVSIFGDNATGKTTVFDGWNWLLFGKDSLNSAAFEIKTLDKNGEALHGLEHQVETILDTSQGEITLQKVYVEKYTKRRGEAKKTFTGHTIDHYIDGIPCNQKEYNLAVNAICTEDVFRLLTNPRHFNEVLHWTDRRALLLTVCGDITDEDVIASNDSLLPLPDILGKRKIDDHKKVIAARRAEINRELQKIPTRIDEITASKIEIDLDSQELLKNSKDYKDQKIEKEKELAALKSGGGIAQKEKELAELETKSIDHNNEVAKLKSDHLALQRKELAELDQASIAAAGATEKAVINQNRLLDDKSHILKKIASLDTDTQKLRKEWYAKDETKLIFVPELVCPACGQDIPENKIEAARLKATENFNEEKATSQSEISKKGKEIGQEIKSYKLEIKKIDKNIKESNITIKKLAEAQDVAEGAHDDCKARHEKIDEKTPADPDIDKLNEQKEKIKLDINGLRAGSYEAILAVEGELGAINDCIDDIKKDTLQLDANQRIVKRVENLESQERGLAAEFEKLESELFIIETFIRTKVNILEEKINKKFKHATFRLFTKNINGGLEETCDTTYNGVPYNSMNNGARINTGLDICNTLSEHYDISLPCFIDNSEAVTRLLQTNAQQIRLFVSEGDKTLRIKNTKN